MRTLKIWFLYSLYAMLAGILFLYLLFPSDAVVKYVNHRVNLINPELKLETSKIALAFPPGLIFHDLKVYNKQEQIFTMTKVRVIPSILTLMKTPMVNFQASGYGGKIQGTVNIFKPGSDKMPWGVKIQADLAGIGLEYIEILHQFKEFTIHGLINGQIEYSYKGRNENGNIKLDVDGLVVALTTPVYGLKELKHFAFDSVKTNIKMNQRRSFSINEFKVQGSQINGAVSGSLMIKKPFLRTRLNLKGKIKPHPEFIQSLGVMGNLFKKKDLETGKVFKIRGSFAKPDFSW